MAGLVVVTGATGFVGAAILRHLAHQGWRIRILTRRMPQDALMPDHPIEVVLGDMGDRASLEQLVRGADAIVHCAGLTKALTPIEFFDVNEGGTVRLLEAAQKAAPQARLVHISSLAAREPGLSPYAASKRAGEDKLPALAGARDWVALRPPAVYGPGDVALLPLFKAAKLGLLAYPASPGSRASTLHVADLASAVATLLSTEVWSERVIELDDEHPNGHDWAEINHALGECFGNRLWAVRLPRPWMTGIAGAVTVVSRLSGTPQILSLDKISELYHPDWASSGVRLSTLLPWRPTFALREGFADTLKWYRAEALL
ncbi:NAD-dependent epimerase/dehydratase family protein [Dongia rigui]|uniref:SDR family NAD(P)-dependent oxidoreductase n=1 Tax=Dongia rigui TaxID=940149 RepID=A0ABU5E3X1_9PROT|nr:SDR family NAD(P)-dependent oxidoreductase [Dongia rigui]MDY0874289.1 SDR family NAD(P)-dependent oxidoreductase [Dongia rigui]